jgi:arginase
MGAGPEHLLSCGLLDALQSAGSTPRAVVVDVDTGRVGGEVLSTFAMLAQIASHVESALRDDALPLVSSGNCISSVGTATGIARAMNATPAVVWFDAHADFNTPESTTSGFLDGMAAAILTGRAWRSMTETLDGFRPVVERHLLFAGVRDIDAGEAALLKASRVARMPAGSPPSAIAAAVVGNAPASPLYFHIDLDVVDAADGAANSYASSGGLSSNDLVSVVETVSARRRVAAAALTAYDPTCDTDGRIARLAISVAAALVTRAKGA